MEKVVRTETVGAQGWDGDIVDILNDLSPAFEPDERVVVITEDEYDRLVSVDKIVKEQLRKLGVSTEQK